MFKKDQIFELTLEDYACPRYLPVSKSYYGSMDEMVDFMIRLEDNPATGARYKETLDAAEYYDLDNDMTHTVAGQTLPIFVPVAEVSRLETTREDVRWEYKTYSGTVYPCYASKIEMRQSLIETTVPSRVSLEWSPSATTHTRWPWLCPSIIMSSTSMTWRWQMPRTPIPLTWHVWLQTFWQRGNCDELLPYAKIFL